MTLTRAPCELDKMSLFQDLKLKRRKVDSRCSSDGESVADTSTSSPDLVSPASPKMLESVPSPDSTPPAGAGGGATPQPEDSTAGVFDGGGLGVIRVVPSRSHSPPARPQPPPTPPQPPRPHSSPVRHSSPEHLAAVIRHSPLEALVSPPRTSPLHHHQHASSPIPPPPSSPRININNPSVITSQQQQAVIQSQFWVQNSRINGVKPELIGGNFSPASILAGEMKPPVLSPSHRATTQPQIRQTPTVIMGEAGGVRTMIWSAPAVTAAQSSPLDTHASTSSCWSSGSSNSSSTTTAAVAVNPEESAAQLLLNLGQERGCMQTQRTTPGRSNVSVRSPTTAYSTVPLNMERLWAGDLTQLPTNQQLQALNLSSQAAGAGPASMVYLGRAPGADVKLTVLGDAAASVAPPQDADSQEEDEQPMICMICEDKATGLHYGIITCEGCKGFFKRTVQNRRVYTCVADGNCEITKAQRNRCQYCRFKKCIEQGMVLQAVREDRMPGGRNSGAVYNLYKVKYKKHKKTAKQQAAAQHQKQADKSLMSPQVKSEPHASIPPHLVNGTILKTALTNPSEIVHLRQRLDNTVSSSRDRNYSIENTLSMIQTLIDCDEFQDIATLQNLDDLLDHKSDLSEKLCQIGDSIVYKLVQWTKRLPFYLELPVEVHTRLLTHKWHELLVLTTSAYQAIHGSNKQTQPDVTEVDFTQEVSTNLCTLQSCLTSMMGRPITMDQLRQDVGLMVEKITHVTLMFRRIKLTMEEYVCLKVITMLNQARPGGSTGTSELEAIQERYMTCLRAYTQHVCPQQPTRFHELLVRLPEVQSAAALLLESKMFYVPFLLNSAIQR